MLVDDDDDDVKMGGSDLESRNDVKGTQLSCLELQY